MDTVEALLLGLIQGATELFPVSSLGHAVVIPSLLHWSLRESDASFVPYLVLLHLGTASALLWLYRSEWVVIVRSFFRAALRGRLESADERIAMMLVVATIPAGVAGVLFEHAIKALFATPRLAALFLVVNGGVLYAAEVIRRRRGPEGPAVAGDFGGIAQLSFRSALVVGSCQAFALFPGVSRSGVTMAAGLLAGLRHREAAHFSFLLATPVIAAAGLLEVPSLVGGTAPMTTFVAGAVLAGVAAYLSARFLLRYFRSGSLAPYAGYCVVAGCLALVLLR